ncbi:polyphosphate kinase 2 family protein [Streptomyces sp. NBC_00029]|uniref:PPK2 family polyphosphate kinase n=1 Tax=Streptomyces sp. NBC_00029 TaxID=2903613 RepID=UPI00324AC221
MAGKQNEKRHEKRHEKRKSAKSEKSEKSEKPAKQEGPEKAAKGGKAGKRSDGGGDGARPSLRELLRVTPGERPDLRLLDSSGTPGGPAGKAAGLAATALLAQPLASLQERLYAASTAGDRRRVLLVLQGMDTSGKGGTVKHVIGQFNPSGCRIKGFKAPTEEEQSHPFLWRIKQELPLPGEIGIFDRSHYEDVLIARVRELVPRNRVRSRYAQINRFEQALADDGVSVVKVFLHIGHEEQRSRLLARLDNPDKHWKFNLGDIAERSLWPAYQEAYELALERCSTDAAPWYVVPADRKWYRNWAISTLLLEHLEDIDPHYPKGDFDVEECRRQLLEG